MIEISQQIQNELNSSTYSLTPLVVISVKDYNLVDEDGNLVYLLDQDEKDALIFLSTQKQLFPADTMIRVVSGGEEISSVYDFWEDRNLIIGGIKESININSKKFKINNVQISLSNKKVNNLIFSDIISKNPILNKEISIYYQTPSCKKLSDAILVYKGIITKVEHNFKDVKIQCEDKTQYKLQKSFPIANLGFGSHIVNDSQANMPIPVTYGNVEKAPTVLIRESVADSSEEYNTNILCDDVLDDSRDINLGGFQGSLGNAAAFLQGVNNNCPLYMFKGEYVQIPQQLTEHVLQSRWDEVEDYGNWTNPTQYTIEYNNYISIPSAYEVGLSPSTPASFGDLQGFINRYPTDIIVAPSDGSTDGLWQNVTEALGVTIEHKFGAIDNEIMLNSSFTTPSFTSMQNRNTFCEIPDQNLNIFDQVDDWMLFTNSEPLRWHPDGGTAYGNTTPTLGLWLPKWNESINFTEGWGDVNTDNYSNGQTQLFQWLMLYCTEINAGWSPTSGTEPPIEIVRMPTKGHVAKQLEERLIRDYYYKGVSEKFGLPDVGIRFNERESLSSQIFNDPTTGTPYVWIEITEDNLAYNNSLHSDNLTVGDFIAIELDDIIEKGNGWNPSDVLGGNNWTMDDIFWYNSKNGNPVMNAYPFISEQTLMDCRRALGGSILSHPNFQDITAVELFNVDRKHKWSYGEEGGGQAANPMMPQGIFFRFQISEKHYRRVFATGARNDNNPINSYNSGQNMFITVGDITSCMDDITEASKIWVEFHGDIWSLNSWEDSNGYIGSGLHYNIFSNDGATPLFNKNDFTRFAPIERTATYRHEVGDNEEEWEKNYWGVNIKQTGYGNGVSQFNTVGEQLSWRHDNYFGRWGQAGYNGISTEDEFSNPTPHNHNMHESIDEYIAANSWSIDENATIRADWLLEETFPYNNTTGHGTLSFESCFCLYVNDDIPINSEENFSSWNEDFQVSGEYKYNECIIPKYTTLPITHANNSCIERHCANFDEWDNTIYRASWISGATYSQFSNTGTLYNYSPEYVSISSDSEEAPPSQRLGLIFPVKDIELEDTILTKTLFTGKIMVELESGSGSNTIFSLALNKVEYDSGTKSSKFFQEDMNFFHDRLIDSNDITTDVLDDTDYPFLAAWSSHDGSTVDEVDNYWNFNDPDFISDKSNRTYGGFDDIDTAGWNNVSDYTAFCLQYFVKPNDGNGTDGWSGGVFEGTTRFKTQIYDAAVVHFVHFNPIFNSNFYADVTGRINNDADFFQDSESIVRFKYTGFPLSSMNPNRKNISLPSDIMFHLLEKEFNLIDFMNYESLNEARDIHEGDNFAFTVTSEITGKSFFEKFSSNTMLFPSFKSTSEFSFLTLKGIYQDSDVDMIIKRDDIISYNFSRTSVKDVKTLFNIKYAKDYQSGEYTRETGWVDGYDMFGNGDGIDGASINSTGRPDGYKYSYLGIEREDNVVTFEAEYIRNPQTAYRMRDYMYLNSCNQHNIFKITLPLRYFSLEVGDIIKFDGLINNMKAYGEDYTQPVTRNGQGIYPYFIITSINKKRKKIEIVCYQVHELVQTYTPVLGGVTRLIDANDTDIVLTFTDSLMIQEFIDGNDRYFTSNQKQSADINGDGIVGDEDLYASETIAFEPLLGDINQDGIVNVADLVGLVNYIMDTTGGQLELDIADINEDGIINVVDVVALVNYIIQGDF